ncbi:MAG: S41 family peptidase [Pseudomonadota bacterium]
MKRPRTFNGRLLVALIAALAVSGCGGSSGPPSRSTAGNPPPTTTPPPSSGPTWTAGVFQPASTFKDRCQVVRTGVDIEGNPFTDQAGSTLEENFWLRSWTNETYLWNTEVVDRDPAAFSSRLAYFAQLRTFALTPSGKEKDDFHFSQPTTEFLERRNSTPRAGYGAQIVAFSTTVPRDFRIQYTEPNSPASEEIMGLANFVRGARILEVDGIDVVNAPSQAQVDLINDALFPLNAGEQHTFVVLDPGAAMPRTVILNSVNIAPKPVNRIRVIDTPTGKVGYILLTTFSPFATELDLANAFASLAAEGVSDVVLDLRYNGGGLVAVAAQLGYMVAGPARTSGRTFEDLRFNAAAGGRNPVTGETDNAIPFYSTGLGFSLINGAPLSALNLGRVYILTTAETCSASEAVINGLRGIDVEVVLIGETTCGKPFGFYPTDNCGETYFTIQFQGVNEKGFGDYTDGFIANNSNAAFGVRAPGCAVTDDYSRELGDENEAMLAAALQYRSTGSCPVPPVTIGTLSVDASLASGPIDPAPNQNVMRTNRDMRLPD